MLAAELRQRVFGLFAHLCGNPNTLQAADRMLSAALAQPMRRAFRTHCFRSDVMSNVERQAQRANVPVWFEIPAAELPRVPKAGGEVLLPRTALPDGMGYFAQIRDTEGNRVGLHAMA